MPSEKKQNEQSEEGFLSWARGKLASLGGKGTEERQKMDEGSDVGAQKFEQ